MKLTLIILNIISLILILQIDLGLIPLIDSNLSLKLANGANNLFLNLSYGLLISSIFFLIVVYYPEKKRKSMTMLIIQSKLDTINRQLQESILYLYSSKIDNVKFPDISQLNQEAFENILRINAERMNFEYKIKNQSNQWIQFSTGRLTEIDHFTHEKELITQKVDEIFAVPTITSLDNELLKALYNLKHSFFYTGVNSYAERGERTTVMEFNKGIYQYYMYTQKIMKYSSKFEIKS